MRRRAGRFRKSRKEATVRRFGNRELWVLKADQGCAEHMSTAAVDRDG